MSEAYDVFVSYSRADTRHAADIDAVLRSKGLSTFFDRRELAAGSPWVRALEQAIGAAKAVVVLIGPGGLGNTQQYERELALIRQSKDPAFPVVPVVLPETASDRPFDFLNLLTWVDFSKASRISDLPEELQRLLAAVRGLSPDGSLPQDAICPYRGLSAFREEDAAFFFGRGSASEPESPIGQLVRKVHEHCFVMVVGRSGSGKSSLVTAGLLPALRRERELFWSVLSLRPGSHPLRTLAAAFNPRGDDEGSASYQAKISEEAEKLRSGNPELLAHMIRDALDHAEGKPDRLLLYIDQWEELYAQAPPNSDKERATQHAAEVNRFIDLLLTASRTAPVSVVATVRADFYDPLIKHQEMRGLLPNRQVLLGSMPRAELERTIVEPARKVGLSFDPPGLVQQILDEAGEDEGMLPLLQYALEETWALREGTLMTAGSYARSGGVRGAIRKTADRTFELLSDEDKRAVRRLFLSLVRPGEGQEDTRARASMPAEPSQRKIIDQFSGPRTRLLVTGFDSARRPTVEVTHEALIRTWPHLRGWIDANREKLRARTAILQAKVEWEQSGRRGDMLLPAGFQLERARSLMADPGDITTDDLEEFVSLSVAREETAARKAAEVQRRQVRNRNYAIAAVSFLAIAAFIFAGVALWAYSRAEQERKVAQEQKEQADSLLKNAMTIVDESPQEQVDSEAKKHVFAMIETGAAHGDVKSIRSLGVVYSIGWGVVKDYVKAREHYEKAAEQGDATAMYSLGLLYHYGHGVPQDHATARTWYEKAARNGNADAMNDLGVLYHDGLGVAQDHAKARAWYEKAADKGNATAMYNLGVNYENGQGVAQDYAKAREWYEKAADKGDTDAMNDLGGLYNDGHGVLQDYAKAREWYQKAADKGGTTAMYNLAILYDNGRGVPKDYGKAREWYEKAADKGYAGAMYNLGVHYHFGEGVVQDYTKAREWYEKAADKGHVAAMINLGWLYKDDHGGAQDFAKAREWWEKAAAEGVAVAMSNLAALYIEGEGVTQDYAKGRELLEKAADKGLPMATANLGVMYATGQGVAQDDAKARELFEKAKAKDVFEDAANQGDPGSMLNLGLLYDHGYSVAQDYSKARDWYEKAAGKGLVQAMVNLGALYMGGQGVAQDHAKARELFEKAAEKGVPMAMRNLGVLYAYGFGVAQDFAKARELFEKAADRGVAMALLNLGDLYENGRGVAPDYAKAREWYEKAAGQGEPSAPAMLEALPISEAVGAGHYADALRLCEALEAKQEQAETKRDGKPGKETADALNRVAWQALLARDFPKALTAAERAHALLPVNLTIETDRAHALLFKGHRKDATVLYLAYKGRPMSERDSRLWEHVIAKDFVELRKAGLTHPMMPDIEKKLGIAPHK